MVGLLLGLEQKKRKNILFIDALVRKDPFCRALGKIRAKIEKNALFGNALVRIRAK